MQEMRISLQAELLDREYAPGDEDALIEIERDAGEACWDRAHLTLCLRNPGLEFRVVSHREQPETPLGFYVIQGLDAELYLSNLGVRPAWRRRGIGTFALENLERLGRRKGCHRILLDVQERNLGAQLLYRSLGYRAVQIRHGVYGDQDGYRMERLLLSPSRRIPGG